MKKIKIDAYLIVMAIVTAGIGAYVLLTGNWATSDHRLVANGLG